mmetsp:Transcript_17796/g.48401  ORF Transcript_17796/g.48401 Transcript_17796/m.48401 type:complete len:495 (-) Transcript_17796:42-1526(-)
MAADNDSKKGATPDAEPSPSPDENDSSSEEEEDVEAAVLSRSKRSTAGRRLTSLVGKAAEEDQAFWGHDTWVEEGSDNDSFRESDEESEQRVDTFDSDFDDSEDDNEQQEMADGSQADKELEREEKSRRGKSKRGGGGGSSKSKLQGIAKAARDLARGGGGGAGGPLIGGPGRIMGDGDNAGIVLNVPAVHRPISVVAAAAAAAPTAAIMTTGFVAPGILVVPAMGSFPPPVPVRSAAAVGRPNKTAAAATATRHVRRATQQSKYSSRYRAARNTVADNNNNNNSSNNNATSGGGAGSNSSSSSAVGKTTSMPMEVTMCSSAAAATTSTAPASPKRKLTAAERAGEKRKRHRIDFTQEELLLEAVHTTSPENERWLLGRKRAAEELETNEQTQQGNRTHGHGDKKLVERFSSKRGMLNVMSFFEMDHVPQMLLNNNNNKSIKKKKPAVCAITGQPARYRDPKSGLPYADKEAYAELRKQVENGTLKPLKPQKNQ